MHIAIVCILQLTSAPFWLSVFALFCSSWAYLNKKFPTVQLPSSRFVWLGFIFLCSLVLMSHRFTPSKDLIQNLLYVSILLDLLRDKEYDRLHYSSLKIIAFLGTKLLASNSYWFSTMVFLFLISLIVLLFIANQIDFHSLSRKMFSNIIRILMQTIPIVVALFVMLPRVVGFSQSPLNHNEATTGFSNRLDPGSVAELGRSDELAFSAGFQRAQAKAGPFYWRGSVLNHSSGMRWFNDPSAPAAPNRFVNHLDELSIEQSQIVGETLFSIPPFISAKVKMGNITIRRNGSETFSLAAAPNENFNYTAYTDLNSKFTAFDSPLVKHLQIPDNISAETRDIVASIIDNERDPKRKAQLILNWFQGQRFQYTLNPGTLKSTKVITFLESKKGFCEHFAAAYANLARLAGIHSRVVVGFHGGELNPLSDKFIVKGADAHAWVEVYFPEEKGWTIIDPTAVIAPERLSLGGQKYHSSIGIRWLFTYWPVLGHQIWEYQILTETIMEFINSEWDELISAYSIWFDRSIFAEIDYRTLVVVLMLLLFLLVRRNKQKPLPKIDRIFLRYTKKNRFPRLPSETEQEYLLRYLKIHAENHTHHHAFIERFIQIKYQSGQKNRNSFKSLSKMEKLCH